ncbi:hypothetical protein OG372_07265 [Streptomyces sp. NBC_01020]|uniref:hypothetical protein n=1 Tax=unclassified Streptomyces TaxID=2593676 RepID=UPI0022528876|nr:MULTISPECIES: hypothetical protein [unclassified Streptomyces]MCX4727361.1 hypothetical protein [Streptomyces sp. NBC_01306]WSV03401.1 hypothetical protein OG372_07265 [Streptomyces sp. NBC_01020]WSX41433.1 hypothetical protein OG760_06800 [Streptomyces sp. NBC_00963]WSX70593.1 hypothetical protein OG221_30550 [Streptomyces sp. NBC_00932]
MDIDWAALGTVFGVSLVATVGLVGLFTLGVVGLARKPVPEPGTATAPAAATPAGTGRGPAARAGSYACFALCAAAVAYGIYLIVA